MNRFRRGISYAFHRNIGWQDRWIRTLAGLAALGIAIGFRDDPRAYLPLALFAVAQFGTALFARCILCFFAGVCTIGKVERRRLKDEGVAMEEA